jgi:superfamily I DNA and RNA helicase
MINTVWGSTDKPVSSKQLATLLASVPELEGTLYIGYPIIGTPDGSFPIDALFVSPTNGLVLFNLIEGRTLGDYAAAQDEAFNKMRAKLLQHQSLIKKRELSINIHTITFAPAVAQIEQLADEEHVHNTDSMLAALDGLAIGDASVYPALVAVIQAISALRHGRRKRDLHNPDSKGTKIKSLEASIANLDTQQSAAVVETVDGVQRIRGLAGSGKTIVLALKVAYLHARHPDWMIAVTFNTRSLKKQFEDLITTFVLEQSNEKPDWEKVKILNAWGAPGGKDRSGIYYEFCCDHGVQYHDFRSAGQFGADRQFEGACDAALQGVKQFLPKYDAILVDESQDFAPNFLLLCYEYLKPSKRLVYAYDELQNLGKRSLPPVEDIFGKNADGTPRVVLHPDEPGKPKQDIVLDTCYRNSRPVLSTAHALGFGIYRPPEKKLVQIFENKNLWIDIGYEVKDGELEDGQEVSLRRTSKSSPAFLENHSTPEDLISFEVFKSEAEQTAWLIKAIEQNLKADELLPDDIVVINPDPITTRDAVKDARRILLEKGINSNLAGVTSSVDVFLEPGTVTFTGVFRAKGNEAAMVYVINAQDCFTAFLPGDVARVRNRLFTAITRSKAWVRILGFGKGMEALKAEFERAKAANFELRFKYPTDAERKQMTIVNRDMSKEEKDRFAKKQNSLRDIIESLESGDTFIEDYPEEIIRKLQKLIDKKSKKTSR